MADKKKRLRKIFFKTVLDGMLKLVKMLEEAQIIIVQNSGNPGEITIFNKPGYQKELENGVTFPEEYVYFTTPANPRNIRQITNSIIFKASSLKTLLL